MSQTELFRLVAIETTQAYCWNAHARLERLKGRTHPSQERRLQGEMSLFLLLLEKIEAEVRQLERNLTNALAGPENRSDASSTGTPSPIGRAPKFLEVQHLRALNQWPDLALQRARRSPLRRPSSTSPMP